MLFGIILGDPNGTVGLALDEEERQFQLLGRQRRRLVHIEVSVVLVEELVGNLDVTSLELGERDLLLDELQEELLLFPDSAAHLSNLLFALLEDLGL